MSLPNFIKISPSCIWCTLKLTEARKTTGSQRKDNRKTLSSRVTLVNKFMMVRSGFESHFQMKHNWNFGEELSLFLMSLDGKAVLDILDTATSSSAANFLDTLWEPNEQTVDGRWLALVIAWCTIYNGYSNRLCTVQGSITTYQG